MQKVKSRLKQLDLLKLRAGELLARTSDPERRQRIKDRLKRIEEHRKAVGADPAVVRPKDQAKPAKKAREALESEIEPSETHLRERLMPRTLTLQEKRIDFIALQDDMDAAESDLQAEMTEISNAEIDRAATAAEAKIDAGEVLFIGGLAFLFRGAIKKLLNTSIKNAYQMGKSMGSKELGVAGTPTTPLLDTQIMNIDIDDLSVGYADRLEAVARNILKTGVSTAASTAATIAAMRLRVREEAANAIMAISGTVVGQYVNRGRRTVFSQNGEIIVALQRSEVLDLATCAMCASLDKKVITMSDPFIHLDVVHSHCRGVWVPILASDEEQPEITGIAKTVTDRFEKVDGRPMVNAFKQIKKKPDSK